MPRPMLKANSKTESNALSLAAVKKKNYELSEVEQNTILRKQRSPTYVKALSKLDAGSHVQNADKVQEIVQGIKDEFPELELSGLLIGIVSKCYLGEPYEVHTLDFSCSILHHFEQGEPLPAGMEHARSLAEHEEYAFIEVYTDCCRAISQDGNVSVVR